MISKVEVISTCCTRQSAEITSTKLLLFKCSHRLTRIKRENRDDKYDTIRTTTPRKKS